MPTECDGSAPRLWRVAAAAGAFETRIVFDRGEIALAERSVIASLARQFGPDLNAQLALGAILDGSVDGRDVAIGGLVTIGVSYLALYETSRRPFIGLSASAGASRTAARGDDGADHALTAVDLRVGAMIGKTLFDRLTLYGMARAFGGPVFFTLGGESVTGGDAHHYLVGAGFVLRAGSRLELFAEGAPLGERSFSVGASLSL